MQRGNRETTYEAAQILSLLQCKGHQFYSSGKRSDEHSPQHQNTHQKKCLSAHTRTSHPPTHPSHKSSSTPLPLYFHKNAPPPLPSLAHLRASASRLISDGANVAGREVKGCRWKCQTNPGGTRRCLCALFCNIVSIPPLISTPSAPFTLKANLLTLSVLLPLYFFALPYSNLYF